ncbi:hypothetical protein PQO01_16870 [Lentisphaera marina]|uniref:hypothetical protein n=1 Tax=Lentisphaera marina TaxID=1111041 RepID=UPI002366E00C|nr:hypothetical protein [Lentisphaera marina]MDD7986626.1 hypothetical protein [Lentisphaera marina]
MKHILTITIILTTIVIFLLTPKINIEEEKQKLKEEQQNIDKKLEDLKHQKAVVDSRKTIESRCFCKLVLTNFS